MDRDIYVMDTHTYIKVHINLLKSAHMGFPIDGMGKGKKAYSSCINSRYFVPGDLFLLSLSLGQLFMFSRAMFLITGELKFFPGN